jgi:hypothetical protein
MRLTFLFAALVVAGGCGDQVSRGGDDTGTPDAMGEPCGGHGQPECPPSADNEFLRHTGGEVRLEYITTQTGALQVILYAWFISKQDPETIPYATEGCTNLLSYTNNTNAGATINDTRVFMDVGPTVTLSYQGKDIVLTKYENIPDKRGLVMDIVYAKDGNVRGTVYPGDILPGAEYTITLGNGVVLPAKIKVPAPWQVSGGNMVFGANAVNNMSKTADANWNYQYPEEELTKSALLLFGGNNAAGMKESWFCVGAQTGAMNVPSSMMATFPASGTVQAATFAHQKINFNERVLDVIGITCMQTAYTIQ